MALIFEIRSGESKGKKFLIELGIKLGRTQGNLLIPDEKASSLHAEVQSDNKNQLILVDLQSSNGLTIQGRKVKKVSLINGVKFFIGNTEIQVLDIPNFNSEIFAARKPTEESLSEQIFNVRGENNPRPEKVLPFANPISLTFVEGIQIDAVVFISYGPRFCGKNHWDIAINDYRTPSVCFKLLPSDSGVLIENLSKKDVMLNNNSFDSSILQNGDLISVGFNTMKVAYV